MMKKNWKILFLLFAASVLIMACGLSTSGADDAAAPADVAENPAVEAEPIEEPTPVPDMDISGLVLSAADFPDVAFADVPMEELGLSASDLNTEDFTVESFFALLESQNFEMVMGFTTKVQTILDKAGFDLVLNQPETLLNSFIGGMGDVGASEPEELPEFKDAIGNKSAGMTVVANIEGVAMRIDMVVFRHDSIGAFVITMYLDGQQPPASLMDVATKFDEKIGEFLASQ
jgi:hypothetical protein